MEDECPGPKAKGGNVLVICLGFAIFPSLGISSFVIRHSSFVIHSSLGISSFVIHSSLGISSLDIPPPHA